MKYSKQGTLVLNVLKWSLGNFCRIVPLDTHPFTDHRDTPDPSLGYWDSDYFFDPRKNFK